MVEPRSERSGFLDLPLLCCVLEQDTFTTRKVLLIPRKWWLPPYMTEKLFTGTLNHNKTNSSVIG